MKDSYSLADRMLAASRPLQISNRRRVLSQLAASSLVVVLMMVWGGPLRAATPSGWSTDFDAALRRADAEKRPILVAVTAVWCGPCRQMQQLTFNDPSVQQTLSDSYVAVSVDGDQRPDLIGRFGVSAFPTTLVLDSRGVEVRRWLGFQSAGTFRTELERHAGEKKKPADVDEFPAVSASFPLNASPVGFSGFCLVSLLDDVVLQRGNEQFTAEHRGVTICFRTAAHRDKFLRDPARYWPIANGNCLVNSREQQQEPGDPRVGVLWKDRLWFFADRASQRRFLDAPEQFSRGL